MKLEEAKEQFIQSWGSLGTQWGINKTMAQIHALMLISEEALSTEDIMEILDISRGNVNMNVRTLIDWGLVYKKSKRGERKDFFVGEKDIWLVTRRVMNIRRQKELEPMLKVLDELSKLELEGDKTQSKAFKSSISDILRFASQADKTLGIVAKSEENWFFRTFMRIIK